jgi:hypothetical protein
MAAEGVAGLDVGAVEGGDLGLVGPCRSRALTEGRRIDQRGLQLGDQLLEGRRESRAARRPSEQLELGSGDGLAREPAPLGSAEGGASRRVGGPSDQPEELIERAHRRADHRVALAGELRLEALDVVDGGDDEDGVARDRRPESLEHDAGASRVRRPDDQLQGHPEPA